MILRCRLARKEYEFILKGSQKIMDGITENCLYYQDEGICCYTVDNELPGEEKNESAMKYIVQSYERYDKKKIKPSASLGHEKHLFSLGSKLESRKSPRSIRCANKNYHVVSYTFSSSNYCIHKDYMEHRQFTSEKINNSNSVEQSNLKNKINITTKNKFALNIEKEKSTSIESEISTHKCESQMQIKRNRFILNKTESVITRLEHYIYCASYFNSYYHYCNKDIIQKICTFFMCKSIVYDSIIFEKLAELLPISNNQVTARIEIASRKIKETRIIISNIINSENKTPPNTNYINEKLDTVLQIDIISSLARHFSHLYSSGKSKDSLLLLLSMLTEIGKRNFICYIKELENLNRKNNVSQINYIDAKISETVLKISRALAKL
ncbi:MULTISPECIES: hypothetical protein [Candidatus Ichthyocystis]|uniref:Uncharacterized protein n=1 Tax=Candidatus Ichthyocystis hellenicum TaxID=1561003 RepID=A0A0S4M5C7_9BURK|nr:MULTISPECIES: hypothetical protein [Ichthyocystis]CUT18114.1 hypothetical protein Ark11_1310 [Candidatus Ichthyocystis hellenicum]